LKRYESFASACGSRKKTYKYLLALLSKLGSPQRIAESETSVKKNLSNGKLFYQKACQMARRTSSSQTSASSRHYREDTFCLFPNQKEDSKEILEDTQQWRDNYSMNSLHCQEVHLVCRSSLGE
jgi:hypothetical protein